MFVTNEKLDKNIKLFKMLGALIDVSPTSENLDKYKNIGIEIDQELYKNLLDKVKQIDEHNHSLEEELQFLEEIRNIYNQVLEFQLIFKKKYEKAGSVILKLSDLDALNIEYIDNRMSAISGYLMNLKNIEINKSKLQQLNDELIDEEKKKQFVNNKLLDLDNALRKNFGSVEGRCIVDGNLQYTSVEKEYEKIGYDFYDLLENNGKLKQILTQVEREKDEVSEKVHVAEVCYNSVLNYESKQILEEVNAEYLKIKYRLAMLKIIGLLSQDCLDYKSFVEKRMSLLELIKFRIDCLEKMGHKVSIDPFIRANVSEQLAVVNGISDNSDLINRKRKEISQLNSWTEQMLSQNNNYLITLGDTRKLLESNMSINDVDITEVVTFDELLLKHSRVLDNQVVSVKNAPSKFNSEIVGQKTTSVLKRVSELVLVPRLQSKEEKVVTEVVPELVIVPTTLDKLDDVDASSLEHSSDNSVEEVMASQSDNLDSSNHENDLFILPVFSDSVGVTDTKEVEVDSVDTKEEVVTDASLNLDMFETVTPFDAPILFSDRAEEKTDSADEPENVFPALSIELEEKLQDENKIDTIKLGDLNESDDTHDVSSDDISMPEVFWTTGEQVVTESNSESEEDFDETIDRLLFSESDIKTRKKVA